MSIDLKKKNLIFDIATGEFVPRSNKERKIFNLNTGELEAKNDYYKVAYPDKYEEVNPQLNAMLKKIDVHMNKYEMDRIGEATVGRELPYWEQAKTTFNNFIGQVKGGTLMALSQETSMMDGLNMLAGVEKNYHNSLYEKAQKIFNETERDYHIYEANPGEFNLAEPTWWFKQISNVGQSAPLIIEGIIESALLGVLTSEVGGSGAAISIGKMMKNLKTLKGFRAALKIAKPALVDLAKREVRNQALFGLYKGFQETTLEGYDAFLSNKEELMSKGFSEEEAIKHASVAASTTFREGVVPLMLLNSLQYATMAFNPITGKTTGILDRKITNSFARASANFLTEQASEGTEELFQELAQQEGSYQANLSAGLSTDESSNSVLRHLGYLKNARTWNAFSGGVLGGTVFTGTGYTVNKLRSIFNKDHWSEQHSDFVESIKKDGIDYIKKINDFDSKGNSAGSLKARRDMGISMGVNALILDKMTDKTTASEGYKSFLENTLSFAQNKNTEKLKELGIEEEQIPFILENFPNYLSDLNDIHTLYNEHEKYHTLDSMQDFLNSKLSLKVIGSERDKLNSKINSQVNSIEKKSDNTEFTLDDKDTLNKYIEALSLEKIAKSEGLTQEQKNRLEGLKSLVENFKPKLIAPYINIDKLVDERIGIEYLNESEKIHNSKVAFSQESKNIRNYEKKKLSKKLLKADTIEKVNEVEKEYFEKGITDPTIQEIITDKKNKFNPDKNLSGKILDKKEPESNSFEDIDDEVQAEETINSFFRETNNNEKYTQVKDSSENLFDEDNTEIFNDPTESDLDNIYTKVSDYFKKFRNIQEPTSEELSSFLKKNGANDNQIKDILKIHDNKIQQQELKEIREMLTNLNNQYNPKEDVKNEEEKIINEDGEIEKIEKNKIAQTILRAYFLHENYIIDENGDIVNLGTLFETDVVDNRITLDPNGLKPGDKLSIEIAENYDNIKVHSWEDVEKGIRGNIVQFKELNLTPYSKEWIERVPMIAYIIREGKKIPAFLIYDTDYFNPSTVTDFGGDFIKQHEIIENSKSLFKDLREKVINNKGVDIEIVSKNNGYKVVDNYEYSINEVRSNLLSIDSNKQYIFLDSEVKVINKNALNPNYIYELRETPNAGEYLAFKLNRPQISEDIIDSIISIIEHRYFDKKLNGGNLNITSAKELENYLSSFLYLPKINITSDDLQAVQNQIYKYFTDKFAQGTPFITMSYGNIYFGKAGENISVINKSNNNIQNFKNFLSSGEVINNKTNQILLNLNREAYKNNSKINIYDSQGNFVKEIEYQNFIKDSFKTKIKAFNIGTENNPKMVTFIQPRIEFKEIKTNIKENSKEESTVENIDNTNKEENIQGVEELFDSNPELANAIYSKILTNSGLSAKNLLSLLLKENLIEKQCS